MAATFIFSNQQILDSNGDPIVGAKLESYAEGTSTPLATYSDEALTTANANPASGATTGNQVTGSDGRFGNIYLQALAYKFILKDDGGNTIWTIDNYNPDGGTSTAFSVDAVSDLRALEAGAHNAVMVQSNRSLSGDFGASYNANNVAVYYWDATSKKTDDGYRYVKPTAIASTAAGRWVLANVVDSDYGDTPLPLEDHLRDIYGVQRAAPIRRSLLDNVANRQSHRDVFNIPTSGTTTVISGTFLFMPWGSENIDTFGVFNANSAKSHIEFPKDGIATLDTLLDVSYTPATAKIEVAIGKLAAPGSALTITNITDTAGTVTVTTSAAHGYSDSDIVYISGANNDYTALNDRYWVIASASGSTFNITGVSITGSTDSTTGSATKFGSNFSISTPGKDSQFAGNYIADQVQVSCSTGPLSVSEGDRYVVRIYQETGSNMTVTSSSANRFAGEFYPATPNPSEYGRNLAILQGEYQLTYADVDEAVADLHDFDHLVLSHNVELGDAADSPDFSWPVDTKFGESSAELTGAFDTKYPQMRQLIRGCRALNPRQLIWAYTSLTVDAPAGSYAGYGLDSVPAGGGAGLTIGTTSVNISSISIDGGTGEITVTTSGAHGWSDNQIVFIFGTGSSDFDNRAFRIDQQSSTTFKLMYVKNEVSGASFIDGTGWSTGSGGTVKDFWPLPSAGLQNFQYWCSLLLRDNIDGVFIDLCAPQWVGTDVRDEAFRIAKAFGYRIMANTTSPSSTNVNFVMDSKHFGRGDYIYFEGAIRAAGSDTSVATVAAVSTFDARRERGAHLAFHYTDADPTTKVGTIVGATQANPVVVTISGTTTTLANGDVARINRVNGMTELNGANYTLANKATVSGNTTFELTGVDGTTFSAFSSSPFSTLAIVEGINTSACSWQAQSASLVASGATATATVTNHGLTSGQTVVIAGADQSDYNGSFAVTVTGDNTFTYTMGGSPASPATGTITAKMTETFTNLISGRTGFAASDAAGAGPSGLNLYNRAYPYFNTNWKPIGGVVL